VKTTRIVLSEFDKTAGRWLNSLSGYSEEQFALKPDADSWSIGQVYNHLVAGTRRYHLQMIARCLEGRGTSITGGKKLPGKLMFLLGSFLPARIKVPASETYTPKQPASIEAVRTGLTDLIEVMRALEPGCSSASGIQKAPHPILGFLNAREWFQLIEMHFRHHLRQKERIEAFLSPGTPRDL
jgi:hypothetical protein